MSPAEARDTLRTKSRREVVMVVVFLFRGLNIGFSIIFMKMTVMPEDKLKPPLAVYLIGILGIIPLIGAIVGFVLVILGIAAYRSWKLIVIGGAGILWSAAVYGTLFYIGFFSPVGRSGFAKIAKQELTEVAHDLEGIAVGPDAELVDGL